MKITREIIINGEAQQVSYELTGIELERCYNEYVNREEKNAIVNRLDEDEFEGIMDIPDDLIQRMAEKYHKFLDEYSSVSPSVFFSVNFITPYPVPPVINGLNRD